MITPEQIKRLRTEHDFLAFCRILAAVNEEPGENPGALAVSLAARRVAETWKGFCTIVDSIRVTNDECDLATEQKERHRLETAAWLNFNAARRALESAIASLLAAEDKKNG